MRSVKQGHGGTRGRRGLRRYLVSTMVVLVLALFTAVVWFAYQDLMPGGDSVPPLIRADAGELKRPPDERGGLPLINAESAVVQALDEPASPVRVERIVPRQPAAPRSTADVIPEALEAEPQTADGEIQIADAGASASGEIAGGGTADPVAADGGPADGRAVTGTATEIGVADGGGTGTDTLDTLLAEIIEAPAAPGLIEPAAGPSDAAAPDPAEVDRLPSPADGMALPEAETREAEMPGADTPGVEMPVASVREPAAASAGAGTASSPAATAQPNTAPATAAAESTPVAPSAAPGEPSTAAGQPSTARGEPSTAAGETAVAALPSPTLAPSFDGAFRVQLLAATDEAAVAGAWNGLQARYPSALGPLRSAVQRAEIGGSTFFRLHAGPFADQSGANAVCAALQAQGTDCFVVAPAS